MRIKSIPVMRASPHGNWRRVRRVLFVIAAFGCSLAAGFSPFTGTPGMPTAAPTPTAPRNVPFPINGPHPLTPAFPGLAAPHTPVGVHVLALPTARLKALSKRNLPPGAAQLILVSANPFSVRKFRLPAKPGAEIVVTYRVQHNGGLGGVSHKKALTLFIKDRRIWGRLPTKSHRAAILKALRFLALRVENTKGAIVRAFQFCPVRRISLSLSATATIRPNNPKARLEVPRILSEKIVLTGAAPAGWNVVRSSNSKSFIIGVNKHRTQVTYDPYSRTFRCIWLLQYAKAARIPERRIREAMRAARRFHALNHRRLTYDPSLPGARSTAIAMRRQRLNRMQSTYNERKKEYLLAVQRIVDLKSLSRFIVVAKLANGVTVARVTLHGARHAPQVKPPKWPKLPSDFWHQLN